MNIINFKNKKQNISSKQKVNHTLDSNVEIECVNIEKSVKELGSAKTVILKNINLQINKGEITIILGPSGSGKTTLLNVIAGIDKATSGNCFVKNVDINSINDKQLIKFRRNHISYIYQRYGLIPILSCYDNIRIGQHLVEKKKRVLNIDDIVKIVDIEPLLEKFPHELSGGQRQRVAIARAIIKQPEIMLCDEPTGALDSETSKKIINLFLEINKLFNTTIVMVTHEPSLVNIATKVIYIEDGQIEKIETFDKVTREKTTFKNNNFKYVDDNKKTIDQSPKKIDKSGNETQRVNDQISKPKNFLNHFRKNENNPILVESSNSKDLPKVNSDNNSSVKVSETNVKVLKSKIDKEVSHLNGIISERKKV